MKSLTFLLMRLFTPLSTLCTLWVFSIGFLVVSGATLNAQQIDLSAAYSITAPTAAQIQHALNNGRALFASGSSDDKAEGEIQAIGMTAPNTAQWHIECAANLLRVAFACKESNDPKTAQRVAKRVLDHLDQAEKLFAGDADSLSSVYELRGVIREQLLGDTNQAAENYRAALKLKPDNASAKQRVQLLRSSEITNQ